MAVFDNSNYALRLATSGEATNALTALVPSVSVTDLVFTLDDLNVGDSTLSADDSLLGDLGVYWAYELNEEFRISGGTLDTFVGSSNDDVIDLTGSDGGYISDFFHFIEGGEGNDVLWAGGDGADIFGDFAEGLGPFVAGHDQIVGSNFDDFLFGDVVDATEAFVGGDDVLFALSGNDELYGDALGVEIDETEFGDDFLAGGAGRDRVFGDSSFLVAETGDFIGGDDILNGDAGKDTVESRTKRIAAKAMETLGKDRDEPGQLPSSELRGTRADRALAT